MRTAGRPESASISAIDDASGALVGIRYAVAVLAARLEEHLSKEDHAEIAYVLNLTDDIQDYLLQLRAVEARAYQRKEP